MLQRYLLLWLVLSSLLAGLWPRLTGTATLDPFTSSKPLLGWLVTAIMFCVGTLLPVREVADVLKRWPLILGGTAVQYTAMPALAWGLTLLIALPSQLRTGVILVGCVPGAMASNVLTILARGNVSYSVGLTTSATLLSPLIVPLALRITLGAEADTQLLINAAVMLCLQVVLPVIVGFILCRRFERFAAWSARWCGRIANMCILWVIAVVVALNRERIAAMPANLATVLVLLNLGGFAAGYAGGLGLRLTAGMRRALMLEVGMQNAGVGAALAVGLFPDQPDVALPCGLFAFGCMLTGTVLAQALGMFPPTISIDSPTGERSINEESEHDVTG